MVEVTSAEGKTASAATGHAACAAHTVAAAYAVGRCAVERRRHHDKDGFTFQPCPRKLTREAMPCG